MVNVQRAELGEVAELRRDGATELIRVEVPERAKNLMRGTAITQEANPEKVVEYEETRGVSSGEEREISGEDGGV